MKRKYIVATLIVSAVISGFALNMLIRSESVNSGNTAQEAVSVRMKWFYSGTMSGWFAGLERGSYRRRGIDLKVNAGGPDNNSIKLVASGADTFGIAGADEVLQARAKGIPVVAIGVLFKESPICFVSKRKKNIRSPTDWAGRRVEVSYGSNAEVQYRAIVEKYSVRGVQETPYTFNLAPFIEDKVDVTVAYCMDQVITLKRRAIDVDVLSAKALGVNPYGDVIITLESTLRDRPGLVNKFMAATKEAQTWAIANPTEAVGYLVTNAEGLDKDNEIAVWTATIPIIVGDDGISKIGVMQDSRWQDSFSIMKEYGHLSNNIDVRAAYKNVLAAEN